MTKILLAVEESVLNQLDITTCPYEKCLMLSQKCDDCILEYFSKAKQDAQEMIKQAKLGVLDEFQKRIKFVEQKNEFDRGFNVNSMGLSLAIFDFKSEIEKE